ncbi:MAG: hypothetical protein AUJ49_05015 [Desulfovibrionaceae bacterium CG1_02_65_16]|nr:MAG: hypothetical protein AUJ49_05015 [Desulfovibrionaceae bacterium CG1_02_65_16]
MAVNRAGFKVSHNIRWWATYHPEAFYHESWDKRRKQMGGNTNFTVVTHHRHVGIERAGNPCIQFPGPSRTGSSGLLAVLFGIRQGYLQIILAGVPLDHPDYRTFQDGWNVQKAALRGRVSSLSGWTKTFLEGLNHGA